MDKNQNQTNSDAKKSGAEKMGYGNVGSPENIPGKTSPSNDMANSSQQQFGSDKPTPDERSNRDRTGKYDEADPIWVNPDVQMNNDKLDQDVSNTVVDSQTKAP